jgi:hypothetical protein
MGSGTKVLVGVVGAVLLLLLMLFSAFAAGAAWTPWGVQDAGRGPNRPSWGPAP